MSISLDEEYKNSLKAIPTSNGYKFLFILSDSINQLKLEAAAYNFGRKVRKTMEEISGTLPEDLPKAQDIKLVQKDLKSPIKNCRKRIFLNPLRIKKGNEGFVSNQTGSRVGENGRGNR